MQQASRTMPKRQEDITFMTRVIGGTFLSLMFGILVYLVWMFSPHSWGVVALLAVMGVYSHIHHLKFTNALQEERANDTIGSFARQFDFRNTDTWIIRAVYEELTDYVGAPVRADDHIRHDLRIDDEEYDMSLIPTIAKRCGRSLDKPQDNPYFEKATTVGGLVRFLQHQPRTGG